MVLLAKNEPGGAAGLVWEKAGAEGAIEVHPRFAYELLNMPGDLFFIVEQEVKKVEKAVKAEVEKIEDAVKPDAPAAAEADVVATDDIDAAVEVASSTKRRSTKA